MAIPDYQSLMMPLMQYASDEQIHSLAEACDHLARHFELDEDALKELLPSVKTGVGLAFPILPNFRGRVLA